MYKVITKERLHEIIYSMWIETPKKEFNLN